MSIWMFLIRCSVSLGAVLIGLAVSPWASAQSTTLDVCDSCSASQMQDRAWLDANDEAAPYWGEKYYVNRHTGEVRKFEVMKEPPAPDATCTPWVTWGCNSAVFVFPMPLEQDFIQGGIVIQQAWNSVIYIDPGPGIPQGAYEYVSHPQGREAVMAQAHFKGAVAQTTAQVLRGLLDKYFLSMPPKVVSITLVLPDGSRVRANYDVALERLVHEKGSVRDRIGNWVPETPVDISGGVGQTVLYDFTGYPSDLAKWQHWVQSLGATLSSSGWSYRCTQSVENSEGEPNVKVVCTAY
ncbi:hypothetical protein ACTT2I_03910 [Stenotrophomonas sp. PUT21]|uniref:hypothetical protein n=1 Tax=Stenotrophomonas TaxID=40323 RepID=UPI0011813F0A|nr:hypothetical protein [Stenotrophomonas maltophilia]